MVLTADMDELLAKRGREFIFKGRRRADCCVALGRCGPIEYSHHVPRQRKAKFTHSRI